MSPAPVPGLVQSAMPAWMAVAFLVGVVAPTAVLLRWRHDLDCRRALGPLVAVLLAQIAVEAVLTRVLFVPLALASGAVFSLVRLWQLGRARRILRGAPIVQRGVVVAGLLFWPSNLALLAFLLARAATS